MLTNEQAAQLIHQLHDRVQMASGFGATNDPNLRDVRVILFKLRDAPLSPVVLRDRLTAMKNWIEILFTNPRHDRFGGTETVRNYCIQHCDYMLALLGVKPFASTS